MEIWYVAKGKVVVAVEVTSSKGMRGHRHATQNVPIAMILLYRKRHRTDNMPELYRSEACIHTRYGRCAHYLPSSRACKAAAGILWLWIGERRALSRFPR